MVSKNKLEKDIERKEEELLQEFKEELKSMNEEEFTAYFNKLVDNYYKILFNFEADYSKYYADSKQQYKTIKQVKKMLASKYNNLDNYENGIRLEKAESIAYNYMLELNSMEESYTNIIYHSCTQELLYINTNLTNLIGLYEKEPSEALLDVIEEALTKSIELLRVIKKLPVYDNIEEITEEVTFKKEHLAKEKCSKEDIEAFPEEFTTEYYTTSILSVELKRQLEEFEKILEKLENILPEDIISAFEFDLNSSEAVNFLNSLVNGSIMEYDEAVNFVAYSMFLRKKNNKKNYLFNIIEEWS